jgi:hypothetical protein
LVVDFKDIADSSRLWIFQINRPLTVLESEYLSGQTNRFLASWAAHGTGLVAAFSIVKNRFLLIAADESKANASGCSIDSMTHFLKDMQTQIDIDFFDRSQVIYQTKESLKSLPFIKIREMLSSGELSGETLIFNTVLQQKGELSNQFIIAAKDSWLM